MDKKEFLLYRAAYEYYKNLESAGAGHVMSPCNPRKIAYKKAIGKVRAMIEKNNDLFWMYEEVVRFEKLFTDVCTISGDWKNE